ncbi:Uncharacterised protein at_DN1874 [Pycnogonum litorale]
MKYILCSVVLLFLIPLLKYGQAKNVTCDDLNKKIGKLNNLQLAKNRNFSINGPDDKCCQRMADENSEVLNRATKNLEAIYEKIQKIANGLHNGGGRPNNGGRRKSNNGRRRPNNGGRRKSNNGRRRRPNKRQRSNLGKRLREIQNELNNLLAGIFNCGNAP